VALPFSIANRIARGQTFGLMTLHAFWRALILILARSFSPLDTCRTNQLDL
jgi:hypothetical protein